MFSIGEFSRLARVSCRLLRYYGELGLIEPKHTDSTTGYRYYSASQLPQLNRILVLKELGLSLEQIALAVREGLPAAELRGMLLLKRSEIEQSIEIESQRLKQIESRIAQVEAEGRLVADDVIVRDEPAHTLLSVRQTVKSFAEGLDLVGKLVALVPKIVGNSVVGQFVVIAHALEFEPDSLDVEMGFYLQGSTDRAVVLPDGREMIYRNWPGGKLATCVRIGPPQQAHLAAGKIAHFVESNGFRIQGPSREVFLQRPNVARMQEAVVEMQFPIVSV